MEQVWRAAQVIIAMQILTISYLTNRLQQINITNDVLNCGNQDEWVLPVLRLRSSYDGCLVVITNELQCHFLGQIHRWQIVKTSHNFVELSATVLAYHGLTIFFPVPILTHTNTPIFVCFAKKISNKSCTRRSTLQLLSGEYVCITDISSRLGYSIEVNSSVFFDHVDDGSPADKRYKRIVPYTIDLPNSIDKIRDQIPGVNGLITYKAVLASRGGKYIPKGFHLPQQKQEFLRYLQDPQNKNKRWIQKDPRHRGIEVKEIHKLDLQRSSLIQEYISRPFLIEGRRFSIGIYVTFSSANPLRAYILDSALNLRLCAKDYYPEDLKDTATYVADGMAIFDIKLIKQVDCLKDYNIKHKYSVGKALDTFFRLNGKDPSLIYSHIYDAVRDVLDRDIELLGQNADPNAKYYQFTRWDFILDEDFNMYLLEVEDTRIPNVKNAFNACIAICTKKANIDPSLEPPDTSRIDHNFVYHILYNLFRIMGLEDLNDFQEKRAFYDIRNSDVHIYEKSCYMPPCNSCNLKKCRLCSHCLSQKERNLLKRVLLEHLKRGTNRLVYPYVTNNGTKPASKDKETNGNVLTVDWLRAKCKRDISWCNRY